MKYLSVCSGIEAATVAWHSLGWMPLAFSEIEAFPRAVLQHHYPDVPLYGDFTKLRDEPIIEDADILVGGTPCQAFSVAGLRKSLGDDRGNLTLEFVRLANAIDNARLDRGKSASIIVWENVPGVLSVKDNAFGCFLAGLAGDVTPYDPPRGKWTNAGVVDGPARTVAWRILDAQYFGLAQRRRRVFVVASARAGFDPAAVLLEFEGVRRDTPPRREKGEAASAGAGAGAPVGFQSSQSGVRLVDTHATLDANNGPRRHNGVMVKADASLSHWDGSEHPHPTLNCANNGIGGVGYDNQALFSQRGASLVGDVTAARMVAFGEYSDDGTASTLKSPDYKDATDLVTHSLRAEGFDVSEDGTGRGAPLVPVNITHTLQTQCGFATEDGTGRGSPLVPVTVGAIACNTGPNGHDAGNFACNQAVDAGHVLPVTYSIMPQNSGKDYKAREVDVAPAMTTEGYRVSQNAGGLGLRTNMAVRRLTPVECERLQGFPDAYTLIPWKKKPASDCPDGPRYKALGNSMAVPVMRWIGQRIARA